MELKGTPFVSASTRGASAFSKADMNSEAGTSRDITNRMVLAPDTCCNASATAPVGAGEAPTKRQREAAAAPPPWEPYAKKIEEDAKQAD